MKPLAKPRLNSCCDSGTPLDQHRTWSDVVALDVSNKKQASGSGGSEEHLAKPKL